MGLDGVLGGIPVYRSSRLGLKSGYFSIFHFWTLGPKTDKTGPLVLRSNTELTIVSHNGTQWIASKTPLWYI